MGETEKGYIGEQIRRKIDGDPSKNCEDYGTRSSPRPSKGQGKQLITDTRAGGCWFAIAEKLQVLIEPVVSPKIAKVNFHKE